MLANYHTHTYHCKHAVGTPDEYAAEAVKNGIEILGFSDHVPYPFSLEGYKSTFRMDVCETEQYVDELKALRENYKGKLEILIGYEAEYYPKEFSAALKNINRFECDYMILAQHSINNEYDGYYVTSPCDEEILKIYVNQLIEGMKTGEFKYVAHPDLVFYRENADVYRREMERLCLAALDLKMPLEFNLLGFAEKRHYPYDKFWEIAAEAGNSVILGCDAHCPENVGRKDVYNAAVAHLKKYKIKPIERLDI